MITFYLTLRTSCNSVIFTQTGEGQKKRRKKKVWPEDSNSSNRKKWAIFRPSVLSKLK